MKQVHIEYVSVYVCVCLPGSYNCIRCIFTERVWLPRDTLRDFPHQVLGSNTSVFTSQDMEQLSHTPTNWPGITNAMTVHICLLPTDQTKQASCPCTSASPSSQMHFLQMEERKRDLYSFQKQSCKRKSLKAAVNQSCPSMALTLTATGTPKKLSMCSDPVALSNQNQQKNFVSFCSMVVSVMLPRGVY